MALTVLTLALASIEELELAFRLSRGLRWGIAEIANSEQTDSGWDRVEVILEIVLVEIGQLNSLTMGWRSWSTR